MKAYIFFSVHERLFRRVAEDLRERHGVEQFAGFVWGADQADYLARAGFRCDPLLVFTRDVLPRSRHIKARIEDLIEREKRLGVPFHRMIWAERHLLRGRSYQQILDLVASLHDAIEEVFERAQPDFIFSEDVSCLTSFLHWGVARHRGIPYWCLGDARVPYRVSVYRDLQEWRHTRADFEASRERGSEPVLREQALQYIESFRERPFRPAGMDVRAKLPVAPLRDFVRLKRLARRYLRDRDNPVLVSPGTALAQRARRLTRSGLVAAARLFAKPVTGERYVLYPIHFQPEASTLVLAPMFLDQVALIENLAKNLPVGHLLYVKEHLTNRGRRPLAFYRRIAAIPGVRLLGPEANTWELIKGAAAIAVITGTMGWEGLLMQKPVITVGQVFYNASGLVYEAAKVPVDQWHNLFARAIFEHRHDEQALVRFVESIFATSSPGFMRNPDTFPEAIEPENVRKLADALMREMAQDRAVWRTEELESGASNR